MVNERDFRVGDRVRLLTGLWVGEHGSVTAIEGKDVYVVIDLSPQSHWFERSRLELVGELSKGNTQKAQGRLGQLRVSDDGGNTYVAIKPSVEEVASDFGDFGENWDFGGRDSGYTPEVSDATIKAWHETLTTKESVLWWALTTVEARSERPDWRGSDVKTAEYIAECVRLRQALDTMSNEPSLPESACRADQMMALAKAFVRDGLRDAMKMKGDIKDG